jgi:Icc-related predicted phosphoesterase
MKILAVSDLHGDRQKAERLADIAKRENVDLVVLAGDLSIFGEGIKGLIKPFKERNLKIAFVPGNHDPPELAEWLENKYKIYNLHNRPLLINDVAFVGIGFANIPPYSISEEEIYSNIYEQLYQVKGAKKVVVVSHIPPFNTKLDDIGEHVGSTSLRKILEKKQPDLCICGHIHETFGLEDKINKTKVINPGQKGRIIEI